MEEYLTSIFAVSAVTAILSLVSYKGGEGVTKFAFAVLVVYTALVPLSEIAEKIKNEDYDFSIVLPQPGESDYTKSVEKAFCQGVGEYICSELSLDEKDVRVSAVGFDFEGMRAELIKVTLSGMAVFADRIKIEGLVESAGLGECEVQIEIG